VHKMLHGELPRGTESSLDTHLIVRGSTGANRRVEVSG